MPPFTASDERQVRAALTLFALTAKLGTPSELRDGANIVLSTVQTLMEGPRCRDRFLKED